MCNPYILVILTLMDITEAAEQFPKGHVFSWLAASCRYSVLQINWRTKKTSITENLSQLGTKPDLERKVMSKAKCSPTDEQLGSESPWVHALPCLKVTLLEQRKTGYLTGAGFGDVALPKPAKYPVQRPLSWSLWFQQRKSLHCWWSYSTGQSMRTVTDIKLHNF